VTSLGDDWSLLMMKYHVSLVGASKVRVSPLTLNGCFKVGSELQLDAMVAETPKFQQIAEAE
jgi:hypothetical protein